MSNVSPTQKSAQKTPCGHAVQRPNEIGPNKNLYMKVEREGAEYIHHYLIKISPARSKDLDMIYIDPEETLIDWGIIPTFELSSSKTCIKPEISHIFKNDNGTFLKVIEDPKSQKMYAFIDLTSGKVKRRQERRIKKVYDTWETINIFKNPS